MAMDGKSTLFIDQLLKLVFQAVSIPALAQNGVGPIANINVALHTADPGVGGVQSTNECTYGSYARVDVVRTSSGWTVSGGAAKPVAPITFPTATSGSETATFWSVGRSAGTTDEIYYAGPISPTIAISNGVTPQLTTLSAVTEA